MNKAQRAQELKAVVTSYCNVCKGMGFAKHLSCPCDLRMHCEESISFVKGSDSKAIVFGVKGSGYEDDAAEISKYALEKGMRPEDAVFNAVRDYLTKHANEEL